MAIGRPSMLFQCLHLMTFRQSDQVTGSLQAICMRSVAAVHSRGMLTHPGRPPLTGLSPPLFCGGTAFMGGMFMGMGPIWPPGYICMAYGCCGYMGTGCPCGPFPGGDIAIGTYCIICGCWPCMPLGEKGRLLMYAAICGVPAESGTGGFGTGKEEALPSAATVCGFL